MKKLRLAFIVILGVALSCQFVTARGWHHRGHHGEANDCYVYLMMDITNNFYKIGMSNAPEYREKTLQSEKPSIIKICAKKYPHRKIAAAIEKALHETFSTKRIRGEWFNLNDDDVRLLVETLK